MDERIVQSTTPILEELLMADFEIACPLCSQVLTVPDELMGQIVQCPSCEGDIQLPPPEQAIKPAAPQQTKKKIITKRRSRPDQPSSVRDAARRSRQRQQQQMSQSTKGNLGRLVAKLIIGAVVLVVCAIVRVASRQDSPRRSPQQAGGAPSAMTRYSIEGLSLVAPGPLVRAPSRPIPPDLARFVKSHQKYIYEGRNVDVFVIAVSYHANGGMRASLQDSTRGALEMIKTNMSGVNTSVSDITVSGIPAKLVTGTIKYVGRRAFVQAMVITTSQREWAAYVINYEAGDPRTAKIAQNVVQSLQVSRQ